MKLVSSMDAVVSSLVTSSSSYSKRLAWTCRAIHGILLPKIWSLSAGLHHPRPETLVEVPRRYFQSVWDRHYLIFILAQCLQHGNLCHTSRVYHLWLRHNPGARDEQPPSHQNCLFQKQDTIVVLTVYLLLRNSKYFRRTYDMRFFQLQQHSWTLCMYAERSRLIPIQCVVSRTPRPHQKSGSFLLP